MKYNFFEYENGNISPFTEMEVDSSHQPSQHVVHSGFLIESILDPSRLENKLGNNKLTRYFVMDEDDLWCKTRKEDSRFLWKLNLKYLKIFVNQHDTSSPSIGQQTLGFRLAYSSSSWHFQALNRSDFERWVGALARVVIRTDLHQRFVMNRTLGSGAYSKVCEAIDKKSRARCAIKGYNKANFGKQGGSKNRFFKEISTGKQLCHPNILTVQEIQETENSIYFLLELCEGGRLQDFIKNQSPLTEQEIRNVMEGVLRGVSYLAEKRIAGLELKLRNVLLRKRKEIQPVDVVLADFNLGGTRDLRQGGQGSVEVMQEEESSPKKKSTESAEAAFSKLHASDVLGAGILCYIMMMGDDILDDQTVAARLAIQEGKIPHFDYKSPVLKRFSGPFIELLQKMVDPDPEKRPTAEACLGSGIFSKNAFVFKDYSVGTEEFLEKSIEVRRKRSESSRSIRKKTPMSSASLRRQRGTSGFSTTGTSTGKTLAFQSGHKNSLSKKEAGNVDLYKKSLLTRTTKTIHTVIGSSQGNTDKELRASPSSSSVIHLNGSDSDVMNTSGLAPGALKRERKKSQFGQEYDLANPQHVF